MQNEKKNKHMTLQDRIEIQECLSKGMTFNAIGKRIGKDPTTVSREVRQHVSIHRNGFVKTEETCLLLMKAPLSAMDVRNAVIAIAFTHVESMSPGMHRPNMKPFCLKPAKEFR